VNAEWFGNTADDLTYILAAMMHIKPSKADRIINVTVAKVGAVGATAGVYGVASLVGTVSTGTAIGTLSGAAANSATLAWVGGSVFTGTIVVQTKSSKHIVTGSLAIGSRTRIILRKRKLDARITEAELWMRGYGNE
jgi:hypothetical protein